MTGGSLTFRVDRCIEIHPATQKPWKYEVSKLIPGGDWTPDGYWNANQIKDLLTRPGAKVTTARPEQKPKITKAQAARLERKRVLREMEDKHAFNCSCPQCETVYRAEPEPGYRSPRMEERRRKRAEQHRWESELRSEPRAPSRSRRKAGLAVLLTGLIIFGAWGAWTLFFAGDSGSVRIAFVSTRDGDEEIYTMLPDGSSVRRLTNNQYYDDYPSWSPDGARIAFASDRDGDSEIYTMLSDGSDVRQLTNNEFEDTSPKWSPDGSRIAFASSRVIYTMLPDGSDVRRLRGSGFWFAWSPDSSRIAFRCSGICTMSSDGSDVIQLTDNPVDWQPAWSSDGSRIVFSSNRDGDYEIYSISSSDGSDLRQLTETDRSSYDWHPVWSPDGSRIAFASNRDGDMEIYTMLPDGSDVRQLTDNESHTEGHPAWAPLPPESS